MSKGTGGRQGMSAGTGGRRSNSGSGGSDDAASGGGEQDDTSGRSGGSENEPSSSTGGASPLGGAAGAASSDDDDGELNDQGQEIASSSIEVTLDPYEAGPLSAVVIVNTHDVELGDITVMDIEVVGQRGGDDLRTRLDVQSAEFAALYDFSDLLAMDQIAIPVLGLYQDASNVVRFRVGDGEKWAWGEVTIDIPLLFEERVVVHEADTTAMEPGFTYFSDIVGLSARAYDHFGELRWVGRAILQIANDGNAVQRTRKNNWFGKTLRSWGPPATWSLHHDAMETEDGLILACAETSATTILTAENEVVPSVGDAVVLFDGDRNIKQAWDLRPFLDVDRGTVAYGGANWAHVNTLAYLPDEPSLLISARRQGVIKLDGHSDDESAPDAGKSLAWILAPHLGWGLAGPDGSGPLDPKDFLLTAVDSMGVPYDDLVQQNLAAPPEDREDFHWPVGQHGIVVTKREGDKLSFLTFNNQASFIFDGADSVDNGSSWSTIGDLENDRASEPYSLMIEYEVDEAAMTVRQVFSYGANQSELYGSYNSGVNLLPSTQNRMMISNGSYQHGPDGVVLNPHVVEVTKAGEKVFHLEVQNTTVSAYHGGRIDLYHPQP